MEYSQPLDSGFAADLEINSTAREYLLETAKWARFLSIIGFIGVGFMVIAAFGVGAAFASLGSEMQDLEGMEEFGGLGFLSGPLFTVLYLAFAAFYFFPTLYFYRFATKTKLAMEHSSSIDLTEAFGNLKSCIKFWGIFTAVIIGLYALIFVFALLGGLAAVFAG